MKFLRLRGVLATSLAVFLLASCGGSDFSEAPTPPLFGNTVAFGASVSDTGNACNASVANCPPSPPYAQGKYSNGTLWIETVAARYNSSVTPSSTGGYNYAFAGARTGVVPGAAATTTPTMVQQMDQYLLRVNYQISPQSLIIIDGITFGNNISATLLQGLNPTAVVTQGVTDIVTMINRLYAAGARHILVNNVPNIGRTPAIQSLGNPAATAGATQLSQGFNFNLAQQITGLRATLSGINLYLVDVYVLEAQIAANPSGFGMTNVTAPCFMATPTPAVCATPASYYYWDGFHPTYAAGQIMAQTAITALGR